MNVINVKLPEIKPYAKNAKKHPPDQVERIANSIKEFGFHNNILRERQIITYMKIKESQTVGDN